MAEAGLRVDTGASYQGEIERLWLHSGEEEADPGMMDQKNDPNTH